MSHPHGHDGRRDVARETVEYTLVHGTTFYLLNSLAGHNDIDTIGFNGKDAPISVGTLSTD